MAANKQCMTRLQKEYKSLLKDPVPHITAQPSPASLLEWHFVLEGTPGSEFEGGVYHGKLVFPPQYPFKPPSISLFTPNGRFAVNTKLCLSMTDYHPESWNPMWSVGTILTGLLSFMYDTQPTTGSITTTRQEKERFARDSLAFNLKNPNFRKLFPEWAEEHERRQQAAAAQAQAGSGAQEQRQGGPQLGVGGRDGRAVAAPGHGDGGGGGGVDDGNGAGGHNAALNGGGSVWLTVGVIVVVLAVAVVPLLTSGRGGMQGWLGPGASL